MKFTDKFVLVPIERYERLMNIHSIDKNGKGNETINETPQVGEGLEEQEEKKKIDNKEEEEEEENKGKDLNIGGSLVKRGIEDKKKKEKKPKTNLHNFPPPPPGISKKVKNKTKKPSHFRWLLLSKSAK